MSKIKLLFLLFTIASYASNTSSRLDALEAHNAKLVSTLEASQKALMQQELNNKNLESKIDELKSELEKLKNTQDDYRIEKSSYDFKMKSNTDLVAAQEKRLSDIIFYLNILVVILVLLLGITYFKVKHDAKETAEEFIRQWVENKATPHLDKKITEVLKTKDDEINTLMKEQITNRVEPLFSSVKASLKDVEADISNIKALVKEVEAYKDKVKEKYDEMSDYAKKEQTISEEELKTIEAKEFSSLTSSEHYKLGVIAMNDAKLNTAINEFKNAIRLAEPESSELDKFYNSMGIAYRKKGEYKQAIEVYEKVVDINPTNDTVYNNVGILYYHTGELNKAIKAYTQALKINPNQSATYTNLFELQLMQNQAFDETLEKEYITRFQEKKESFIHYEMLRVLQNIQNGQASQLEQWQENYKGVSIDNWSFRELRTWIEPMEESETKTRLLEALEVFERHG